MVNLDYKSGATLHEQIESELKRLIISGALAEKEQLPSVRELAVSLTVNPNTVQRAYRQLEQDGFIYSIKGKGSFVSTMHPDETESKRKALEGEFSSLVRELVFLGEEKERLFSVINSIYSEKEDEAL